MDIQDILVFYPHFSNDPTWIIVPCETHDELHFLQQLVCFLSGASIVADERANLPFDSELLLFL
jgi:hypothetical protein